MEHDPSALNLLSPIHKVARKHPPQRGVSFHNSIQTTPWLKRPFFFFFLVFLSFILVLSFFSIVLALWIDGLKEVGSFLGLSFRFIVHCLEPSFTIPTGLALGLTCPSPAALWAWDADCGGLGLAAVISLLDTVKVLMRSVTLVSAPTGSVGGVFTGEAEPRRMGGVSTYGGAPEAADFATGGGLATWGEELLLEIGATIRVPELVGAALGAVPKKPPPAASADFINKQKIENENQINDECYFNLKDPFTVKGVVRDRLAHAMELARQLGHLPLSGRAHGRGIDDRQRPHDWPEPLSSRPELLVLCRLHRRLRAVQSHGFDRRERFRWRVGDGGSG